MVLSQDLLVSARLRRVVGLPAHLRAVQRPVSTGNLIIPECLTASQSPWGLMWSPAGKNSEFFISGMPEAVTMVHRPVPDSIIYYLPPRNQMGGW